MGTSEAAEPDNAARRRRLRFRCWHRGMKEVDLILGRFADAWVNGMSEAELADFESLLESPDPQILAWVTGEEAPSPDSRHASLVLQLIAFHR
jgi:antitoxin CptB